MTVEKPLVSGIINGNNKAGRTQRLAWHELYFAQHRTKWNHWTPPAAKLKVYDDDDHDIDDNDEGPIP